MTRAALGSAATSASRAADRADGLRILGCDPGPAPSHEAAARVRLAAWTADDAAQLWDRVSAQDADLVVVPWVPNAPSRDPAEVAPALRAMLDRLAHYAAHADKHVLLDNSDLDAVDQRPRGHLFKTSVGHRARDVHALPYNVPDPGPGPPPDDARFDVCFQGALATSPLRDAMSLWRRGWTGWRVHFEVTEPFWTLDPQRRATLAHSHAEAIRASRFVLCPRGRALNSRRFFEALSHGRVPILYADAAKLPLEGRIPWDEFTVRVPEGFGGFTPHFVERFLADHDLTRAARLARETWLEYLAPARLRRLIVATLQDSGALPPG
jgi:hypothetical protein